VGAGDRVHEALHATVTMFQEKFGMEVVARPVPQLIPLRMLQSIYYRLASVTPLGRGGGLGGSGLNSPAGGGGGNPRLLRGVP